MVKVSTPNSEIGLQAMRRLKTCGLKPKKTNYMYPECETTFEKDACCGSIPFDSGKFICCDGKLSKKYNHTCCGKKLINPSKYGCCNDRKYDLRLVF